jgi:hypothetical protein
MGENKNNAHDLVFERGGGGETAHQISLVYKGIRRRKSTAKRGGYLLVIRYSTEQQEKESQPPAGEGMKSLLISGITGRKRRNSSAKGRGAYKLSDHDPAFQKQAQE